jgi:hypothetical protein
MIGTTAQGGSPELRSRDLFASSIAAPQATMRGAAGMSLVIKLHQDGRHGSSSLAKMEKIPKPPDGNPWNAPIRPRDHLDLM